MNLYENAVRADFRGASSEHLGTTIPLKISARAAALLSIAEVVEMQPSCGVRHLGADGSHRGLGVLADATRHGMR